MNARELLKEARAELAKAHDHLMELTAKLPMQYFGLVDGNIIQAEDCLVDKLDAYLAAPSESAMEMVRKIREIHEVFPDSYAIDDLDAAALIEGLQRRVPRTMLREIWDAGRRYSAVALDEIVDNIAAKHGVVIE
jgi:hypothetical protein